jgi:heptosyltransferase-2
LSTFETIGRDEIRYDCRYYTGYKPCGKADTCVGCTEYSPRGTRILLIKLGAMGDVLRTTCLLPGLRKAYSPCHITWITAPESRDLLRFNPMIDCLRTVTLEDVLALDLQEFDLVLNFDKDDEALALAQRVRAKERRGFAPHPNAGTLTVYNDASLYALRLGLSDELKFRKNTKTYPEIVYEMAELPYAGESYVLGIDPEAHERAAARVRHWIRSSAPSSPSTRSPSSNQGVPWILGLNTGCGGRFATKQWTVEGFVGLARAVLEKDPSALCLLFGGERERDFNAAILQRASHPRLIDTGTQNPLTDFIALVEQCDALVSSDSLGMHIAIAMGKPVVALFGPTAHQEVDLFDRGEKIVTDFPCSPCYLRVCPLEISCMEALKSGTVLQAVRRIRAAVEKS